MDRSEGLSGVQTPPCIPRTSTAGTAESSDTSGEEENCLTENRREERGRLVYDDAFFQKIEKEWYEDEIAGREEQTLVAKTVWIPVLLLVNLVNGFLKLCFVPISIIGSKLGLSISYRGFGKEVSTEKKKESVVIIMFVTLFPLTVVAYFWTFVYLFFPLTSIPMLVYLLFIKFWDTRPEDGSAVPRARYWGIWRHFANYFPVRVIKTADLDPERKYVFCYHPHGIIGIGAWGGFGSDACGFSRKFPGIDLRLLTLELNFWTPFIRELLISMGVCSASKKSCNQILARGSGSAIMLVVGGAAESLDTEPGTYRLTLQRKGFVRVALDAGAELVPVLGFGENDVFSTAYYPPESSQRKFQEFIRRKLGFATPVFWGRSIVTGNWGLLPHRKPVIVVVGKPITLPKLPDHLKGAALSTTPEGRAMVDKYHDIYVKSLRELWDNFKNRLAMDRQGSLRVVK
uniref:Acyltransferase n=1 Tax=Mucochytrium quahogii TaxID=96639 RepID=A0A7S2R9X6_9STRA|mmetsp:Transcript_8893/g.14450  ORF Transcript_8893/g.14450 Transcript_8893/m.14450 type:complete len:458 (+) Transcript_8893:184-1557(+)